MQVTSKVGLTIPSEHKRVLWGIPYHHVNNQQLDEEEHIFIQNSLSALDPDKKFESWYINK